MSWSSPRTRPCSRIATWPSLLRLAPCDVAVTASGGEPPVPGLCSCPSPVPTHDWSAIELGAWLACGWEVPLRLAGPAVEGGRDASRLLATPPSPVQRALGVAAEPLPRRAGPDALVAAAADAGVDGRRPVRSVARGSGLGPAGSGLAAAVSRRYSSKRASDRAVSPGGELTRFTGRSGRLIASTPVSHGRRRSRRPRRSRRAPGGSRGPCNSGFPRREPPPAGSCGPHRSRK